MASDIEKKAIENLLRLKPGALETVDDKDFSGFMVGKVVEVTDELSSSLKKNDYLKSLPEPDLVQKGITIESLDNDRQIIRDETFQVYRIGKALLVKLYDDVKDQVNVNDRMYLAIAKMLDSVNTSLAKLFEMNNKMKQEAEFKAVSVVDANDSANKTMTIDDWMKWVEASKETPKIENQNITDIDEG